MSIAKPQGLETKLGTAILEANKAEQMNAKRIARMVIVSDFTSNNGPDPLEAARQVKGSDQAVQDRHRGAGHRERRSQSSRRLACETSSPARRCS